MKRNYLMTAFLFLCIGTLVAQNVNVLDAEMDKTVQKKSKELIRE
jgi:hypothetical protein